MIDGRLCPSSGCIGRVHFGIRSITTISFKTTKTCGTLSNTHIQTQIHFDNEVSETRTLIEVEAEDHLGLLYMISQTLSKLAVDIIGARIVTERGAAIDSFYVCELSGGKIDSPERQSVIERRLREAIHRLRSTA